MGVPGLRLVTRQRRASCRELSSAKNFFFAPKGAYRISLFGMYEFFFFIFVVVVVVLSWFLKI